MGFENKKFIIFSFLISFFPLVALTADVTNVISSGADVRHYSKEIKNKNGRLMGVDFFDKNNHLKLHLDKFKTQQTFVNGHGRDQGYELRRVRGFYFCEKFDHLEKDYATADGVATTTNVVNDLYVYDLDGNIVFEKLGVPDSLEDITENGSKILCKVDPIVFVDKTEGGFLSAKSVKGFTGDLAGKLIIYSSNGNVLHEQKAEQQIDRAYLSPAGEWMAYEHITNEYVACVENVITGHFFYVPENKETERFSGVTDSGDLLANVRSYFPDKAGSDRFSMKSVVIYKAR